VDEIFEQIVNDRNMFDTLQRKKEHLSKIMSRGRYDKSRALKAMSNVVENYLLFYQTKKRISKVTQMKVAEKLLETSIKDINRLGEDLFDQSFSKRNYKEASEIRIAHLEKSSIEMWHGRSNFKFNTIYYSSTLSVNFYPLRKLKNGKIQGVQMDFRGKPRLMSHLDSDFDFLGMREDTEISSKDEKKILDYVSSRTASIK
jgi:hypothetical protein